MQSRRTLGQGGRQKNLQNLTLGHILEDGGNSGSTFRKSCRDQVEVGRKQPTDCEDHASSAPSPSGPGRGSMGISDMFSTSTSP